MFPPLSATRVSCPGTHRSVAGGSRLAPLGCRKRQVSQAKPPEPSVTVAPGGRQPSRPRLEGLRLFRAFKAGCCAWTLDKISGQSRFPDPRQLRHSPPPAKNRFGVSALPLHLPKSRTSQLFVKKKSLARFFRGGESGIRNLGSGSPVSLI